LRSEKRILIVDDDDAIRTLLMTVLRRRGFLADAARNGVEALEKIGTCRYALILLDLMMPQMDGYDVLGHLGTCPPGARPLVLVLTAGLEPRPINTGLVIGMLRKPFDVELLIDTIAGCISAVETAPRAAASEESHREESN